MPALRLASVLTDGQLIEIARSDARAIVETDPHLARPDHRPLLAEVKRVFHEAWEWVSSG
jgi:hypothetical protein